MLSLYRIFAENERFEGLFNGRDSGFEQGGLEGQIGPPLPDVDAAMEAEHLRECDVDAGFTTGNYGITTTSKIASRVLCCFFVKNV